MKTSVGTPLLEMDRASFCGIGRIDARGKRRLQLKVIRGNGTVRLTEDGVHFTGWLPRKDFFIPIGSITGVSLARLSLRLGIRDLAPEWKARIEGLMHKGKTPD